MKLSKRVAALIATGVAGTMVLSACGGSSSGSGGGGSGSGSGSVTFGESDDWPQNLFPYLSAGNVTTVQDIEARGETSVPDVGTMYRALARMAEAGLIQPADRRPAPDTGDERRNYYRITPAGLRTARAEARQLESLMHAARGLLPKGVK